MRGPPSNDFGRYAAVKPTMSLPSSSMSESKILRLGQLPHTNLVLKSPAEVLSGSHVPTST